MDTDPVSMERLRAVVATLEVTGGDADAVRAAARELVAHRAPIDHDLTFLRACGDHAPALDRPFIEAAVREITTLRESIATAERRAATAEHRATSAEGYLQRA